MYKKLFGNTFALKEKISRTYFLFQNIDSVGKQWFRCQRQFKKFTPDILINRKISNVR